MGGIARLGSGGKLSVAALAAIACAVVLAPPASAETETVGSSLGTLIPTRTVTCPRGDACDLAQALEGNGSPFSPPTGVITGWSVKLGATVPQGIRLVVQSANDFGEVGASRKAVDLGSPQRELTPNTVNTFPERLPIQADETFGVRLEATSGAGTHATIVAPFTGEYGTVELFDPPLAFGGPAREPREHIAESRIALSVEIAPPSPERCDPFNTYTGSGRGDDYGGFQDGGDVIRGLGGNDQLRGYRLGDCIYGGRGDDHLAGMNGNDLLVGGPGHDDIGAGPGNDRILVRDGEEDTVRCVGGDDFVKADWIDRLSNCERVLRG